MTTATASLLTATETANRIGYFTKAIRGQGAFLTVTILGQSFDPANQSHPVSGKRDARALCVANGVKPWNF